MTAGSDLVFDYLSHNHIEPRAEYQFFLDVLLVHSDLSLDERIPILNGVYQIQPSSNKNTYLVKIV